MTAQSITLDIYSRSEDNGSSPMTIDPNMISMQTIPCITINVSAPNICSWVTSKGGWQILASYDIMTLVSAYLGQINLGFIVRIQDINGAIAYYLDMLNSGNNFTGCAFV